MDLDTQKLSIEWVAIERLFCSPANPRRNDEAVPHVAASIRRFGWLCLPKTPRALRNAVLGR